MVPVSASSSMNLPATKSRKGGPSITKSDLLIVDQNRRIAEYVHEEPALACR
ncbi:MAG: hypothetical protein MH186_11765 [Marinobacter sp.]|nr:hypothetical protein [Marinobacter sp.]